MNDKNMIELSELNSHRNHLVDQNRNNSNFYQEKIAQLNRIQNQESTNPMENDKPMHKNIFHQIRAVIIISSTIWYFGFNRAMIAAVLNSQTNSQFQQLFGINFNYTIAKSILSGIAPLGAVFGTIMCSFLIKIYSPRQIYFNTCMFSIIFTIVTMFINIYVLYIFRFFIGITVGIFVALTPSFIRQIVSKDIAPYLGTASVINESLGGLMSFVIGYGLYEATQTVHQTWIIMCCLNVIPLIIVMICIKMDIVYESPVYYLRQMRKAEAEGIFSLIYQPQYIKKITLQKQLQIRKLYLNEFKAIFKDRITKKFIFFRKDIVISIHLPILRKMTGYLVIVLSSAALISSVDNSIQREVPMVLSGVYFVSCFLSNLLIKYLSRRMSFQIGTVSAFILNGILGILYYFQTNFISILMIKVLLIITYGMTLGPLVWPYLPQVVPMRIIPLAQTMNWAIDCLTLTLPSLFLKNIKSAAPLFFIFCGWNFISIIINHFFIVQTKRKSISQIISAVHNNK